MAGRPKKRIAELLSKDDPLCVLLSLISDKESFVAISRYEALKWAPVKFEALLHSELLKEVPPISLVGADGAVHLHAVAAVDLDLAFVIEPGHTENDDALGFRDAFQNFHFLQYGARHDVGSQRFGDLADGLVEFRLIGIAED